MLLGGVSLGLHRFLFFHPFGSPFGFLLLSVLSLCCFFSITVLTTGCSPLPLSLSTSGLLPEDLIPTKKRFSFDFGRFFAIGLFFCCIFFCFSDYVDVAFLEKKWTYQCLDLGSFGFLARFFCLFGVDVLVFRSRDL